MTRLWPTALGVLVAMILVLAPAAAPDRKPPRIVAAAMLDADGDSRADRVRLTYSERVRHRVDGDGRYPFAVSGYRIRSVAKATGKALLVLLVEQAQPDPNAAPAIRYRRTTAQPVKDGAGNQALAQLFARMKAHGNAPPPPAPADADGDGTPDADDCAPRDASIHPKAADTPDLGFVDSNCDGIDGTETDAIFAAPNGRDANPGTKAKPKRQIQAALQAALSGKKDYVLAAFGDYLRVELVTGISIYGAYDPTSWARRDRFPDGLPTISGRPDAVRATGVKDVVLQHIAVRSTGAGENGVSSYGIRAVDGSSLTLQRAVVTASNATQAAEGIDGGKGAPGGAGGNGEAGLCDTTTLPSRGGLGGSSTAGRPGGKGGDGGQGRLGMSGREGRIGTPGGGSGFAANRGGPGAKGQGGEIGAAGSGGAGGTSSASSAAPDWVGRNGSNGGTGKPGNGGGGGGGGGGQFGDFVIDGTGNGGGGGGGGGAGGKGGSGGDFGAGSFGVYLVNSKIVVQASSIAAGAGGAGGRGGDGGLSGAGGTGGKGAKVCTSEVGAGGDGGFGGAGGRGGGGGGGAGGPSIGIFKAGTSTATTTDSKVSAGQPGAGGAGGRSGPGGVGGAGASGIAKTIFP